MELIILGNGFDLDLGLKSRYIDFWRAKRDTIQNLYLTNATDQVRSTPSLASAIDKEIMTWGDLEEIFRRNTSPKVKDNLEPALALFEVAQVTGSNGIHANKEYFQFLKQELIGYLEEQQKQTINEQSLAAECLKEWSEHQCLIYNFNYTNINNFAQRMGVQRTFNVRHIHGNLKDRNIILGVGNDSLYDGYGFLLKKYQGAKISSIEESLLQADKVTFFGVSFGYNDFHYFKEFFLAIKDGILNTKIDMYTRDEQSIEDIFSRLEKLGITRRDLYIKAHLHIVKAID